MQSVMDHIELVPICDVKLHLIRTYEWRMRRKRRHEIPESEYPTTLLPPKTIQDNAAEDYALPSDWSEIYSSLSNKRSILPAIFLSSVKKHCPQHFLRSVHVVGERIWEARKPVHKGAHLFTCAREAGLAFRDTEEIIARLSSVEARKLLHDSSEDALRLGASSAPFFAVTDTEVTTTFDNYQYFKRCVLGS